MNEENRSGAMTDAEFLSKRLARVANLAGVPMPDFSHEGIAEVAGTILGQIASKLEVDRAQDAQAIRNAALEEVKQLCRKWSSTAWIIPEISALQSAPAQPVERPDAVELPPLPAPLSTVEAWVTQDYGRKTSNEILEANDEYYTADQMRDYALAAITANQPQVRGKAQEPVAYRIPDGRGKFDYYGFCDTISVEAMKNAETLYAATPQRHEEP